MSAAERPQAPGRHRQLAQAMFCSEFDDADQIEVADGLEDDPKRALYAIGDDVRIGGHENDGGPPTCKLAASVGSPRAVQKIEIHYRNIRTGGQSDHIGAACRDPGNIITERQHDILAHQCDAILIFDNQDTPRFPLPHPEGRV